MQWTSGKNGGFSVAKPSQLSRSVTPGSFGPEHVNAAEARRDHDSLLHHITRLAKRYRESPELGWGEYTILEARDPAVLAHTVTWESRSMVLLHNLAPQPTTAEFSLEKEDPGTTLVDLLSEESCTVGEDGTTELPLDGYGYRWLRLKRPGDHRLV